MRDYRILVVDDEVDLCEILRFNLTAEGYVVDTANSAEEALTKTLASYDLFLFDVMMGDISGFQLAALLKDRKETATIPTLFLTALDHESDIVKGFDIGADDYITKPFSVKEVKARVRAVIKRVYVDKAKLENADRVTYEGLLLDCKAKSVISDGEQVELTKKEFEILLLLLRNPGEVFSREEILRRIWTDEVIVLDRTIDVNITRLRKKLGQYGQNISTRVGYGYVFNP